MKPLIVDARREELDTVIEYVDDAISEICEKPSTVMQIELTVEEIFVNIASYAYGDSDGSVTVTADASPDTATVTLTFADAGAAFDPTAKKDADITPEGLMSREGGLGIHLVKNIMDNVVYRRENGMNILTVSKKI